MAFETLGQKPNVRVRYPHMMPEDTKVWTRFLQEQQYGIEEVWYDVHVGTEAVDPSNTDALTLRIARGLTRKRIDVVARVGGGFWVIEVKPRAGMAALGQAIIYAKLFTQEKRPTGLVVPMVIADSVDPDIVDQIDSLGVGVIVNSTQM